MATPNPVQLPHIHLLSMYRRFGDTFEAAAAENPLPEAVNYSIHYHSLEKLPASVKFDAVVSPANSYGRLDGAFDDAISCAFAPGDDYHALTRATQEVLYRRWRGFAPPGTCTVVRIPDEFHARSDNKWDTKYVALCPTMRVPMDVRWDREVVYECIWSLLCAVNNHNRDIREGRAAEGETEITSLLMTPLATGCGLVSYERWAAQLVLALKHYVEACENPEQWSSLGWQKILARGAEIDATVDSEPVYH
ncbi:unnamed protein product [Clonostachys rosea]|uniref:Macro domain-like protein n=1 Tax=Bionectria ochroleuca TaxID=29856 RepID=A0ABY6U9H5_BIOOC|nr:unnamed protein product [Clonostachys rosea]